MVFANTNEGQEVAKGYYRWAAEEWRSEVAHNLPLLRSITGDHVQDTVRQLERFSPADRLAVGLAVLRDAQFAQLIGERNSPKDELLANRLYAPPDPGLFWRSFLEQQKKHTFKMSSAEKKEFCRQIRTVAGPILGDRAGSEREGRILCWTYRIVLCNWRVETVIRVDPGPDWHLAYAHTIYFGVSSVAAGLSAMNWLPYGGMLSWRVGSADQMPVVVSSLATACRRFMDGTSVFLP